MPNAVLAEKFAQRSNEHYATAAKLHELGDEWAAVCYFYAAYMAARSALYRDIRLDSDAAARAVHPELSVSSRHVEFHNGNPARGLGMNRLVSVLYRAAGARYELLHVKSVEVRYGTGLINATLEDVCKATDGVLAELTIAPLRVSER